MPISMTTRIGIIASFVFCVSVAFSTSLIAQGGVAALGQSVKRPPAPTGPVPRLPDGTVDLSGLWVGGGPTGDIEREGGLKPGTLDEIMKPEAKKIYASRKEEDNPHYQCMPMGIPRSTPYPFRMIQTPTHKKATHLF